MITGILSFIGSPIIGSIVGVFGSWLTKREDRKSKQLDQEHEFAMSELSHRQRTEYRKIDGEENVRESEAEAFKEAIISESIMSGNKFLDGIRSMIRPLITIYLLTAVSFIVYHIHTIIGGIDILPTDKLVEIYIDVIDELLFLTTMAISFWFGIRPTQKR